MIVQCDKCGAKFHLADDKVTEKGAKVRCSKCKAVFTVKKPKEQPDQSSPPAPSPPPPSPPAAPKPPAAGEAGPRKGKDDDPFSDFNFSDDLDFNEAEDKLTVAAPPPAAPPPPPPPRDLADGLREPAPLPTAKKPAAVEDNAPAGDEGFDFSDEDFSLSDEPAAPPSPPAAVEDFGAVDFGKASPPPPAPPPASGPKTDEFGDFKFDDESFSENQPGPAPAARGNEEWGNVSFTQPSAPAGPRPAGKAEEDVDETGFGDFKFDQDDRLPESGADAAVHADDFVRSPSSRAPVRDDLEASIGDSEPETERREESKPSTPPPPKPVIKMERRKGSNKWISKALIVAAIVLAIPLGFVGYTNSKDWFTFSDLIHFRLARLGPALDEFKIEWGLKERPDTGKVKYIDGSLNWKLITRNDGQSAISVSGKIMNKTRKSLSGILTEVSLKDQDDTIVATGRSYCDVSFSEDEIKSLSQEDILRFMDLTGGRNQKCIEVKPGEDRAFTVVLFPQITSEIKLPLKVSTPEIVGCSVIGDDNAQCPVETASESHGPE
jgi:predicted Zn finger-like uncharacterized protein